MSARMIVGRERIAEPPRPLRAGPLELLFDAGDLRYLKVGGHEVLRRIYAAVRDRNWGTVPGQLSELAVDAGPDGFRVTFLMEHRQREIHFVWRGAITGTATGEVTFAFDGEARSTFLRARIGFCVLHPAACAGGEADIEHTDGRRERGRFPTLVDGAQPVLPFADLRAVTHDAGGVRAEVRFEGDVFEMEDQRNWTDGSFKTFCTPLALPVPVEVRAGTRLSQKVTVRLHGTAPRRARAEEVTVVRLTPGLRSPLPAIGLGVASDGAPLDSAALRRVRALRPAHLRAEWRASDAGADAALAAAVDEARSLDTPVELALFAAPDDADELRRLAETLRRTRAALARILVYVPREPYGGGAPIGAVIAAARAALGPLAPYGAGTNTDLIFYNRNVPPAAALDLAAFAVNPQVHASDEASIVETLEAQEAAVKTAAARVGGLPVAVGPVTLKPRFNPYATAAAPPVASGELPPEVDPRQATLFGATWTAGSLRALAAAGAASVTFYETAGWRGVVERPAGSPAPALFPSTAGGVFPLWHVLADAAAFTGGEAIATTSSDRLAAEAVAFSADGRARVVVVNHTTQPRRVRIEGLPAEVRASTLDATSAGEAVADPEGFRTRTESHATRDGALEIELGPCALWRAEL